MNILFPRFAPQRLPTMLGFAFAGAVVAGVYGAIHDQISYSISPEYFTKMKFQQFHWADAGWPPRVFASVVGVLATWWAGLFLGWFMCRAGLDLLPRPVRRRVAIQAFAAALATAALCGAAGAAVGVVIARGDLNDWDDWRDRLSLVDVRGFVVVAWLHASGYVGALLGLIVAILRVRRQTRTVRSQAAD